MIYPGDIILYYQMCSAEGKQPQRGIYFGTNKCYSIVLMSVLPNSPYDDEILGDRDTLVYFSHDVSSNLAKYP